MLKHFGFRNRPTSALALTAIIAAHFAPTTALASPYMDINAAAANSPVTVQQLRGNISVLMGSGGNIGVLPGPDGIFMVDAGIAVSKNKIVSALQTVDPGKLRYVVNTHWHWDHTDGNGWVRRMGATIIADTHAIQRLKQTIRVEEWGHTFMPVSQADLPNQALSANKTMRLNGERILIRHYRPSHTDGDMSVYFEKADILQTGDTFWSGMYPFIDYAGGGNIDGSIAAANENVKLAKDNTIVIPGHGPVSNRAELIEYRDMLVAVRATVAKLKAQGMTVDQVVAAKPTANYDARWGLSIINGALFTALVYRGV